jgi:cell division septation protein DedD
MSDGTPEPSPAPEGGGLGERVSALESGQQTISGKLDEVLGFLKREPDPPASPAGPERPEVSIADEIRRQLDERVKPPADTPAAAADLAEKTPTPMARRIERVMGWAE